RRRRGGGAPGRGDSRGRVRTRRRGAVQGGRGGPLPGPREHPPRGLRVKHFGILLLKEEKAIFSSPIAYATVAVYLLLMGYTFTAVLFLNRTGGLVPAFFQAAGRFLLLVPGVPLRPFAGGRRARARRLCRALRR